MSNNHKLEKHFSWQFRLVEYLAYFLAFSLPLTFSTKHFYAFNSPKVLLILTVVLLSTIFYLWGKWSTDQFKIKISPLGIVTVLFGLALTLISIFGIDPANSFFGWGNVTPLVAIYALIILAFIIGELIKRNKKVAIKILLASFISGILSVVFFYTGLPDPIGKTEGSTLGNSSYLGGFLVFVFSFGLILFLYFKKIWQKILVGLGLLFVVVNPLFINKEFLLGNIGLKEILNNPMSLLGIANGGALGIVMSLALAGILFLIFSKKKSFKTAGFILAILLAGFTVYTSRALVTEGTKINKVFTEEKSGNRFIAWDIAREGYRENPIWGNGLNNYIYNFEKHFNPDLYKRGYAVERLLQPHNVIWQFASDGGVVGVVSYVLLLLGMFFALIFIKKRDDDNDKYKSLRIILGATIFGYFVQNLFVFDTTSTYLSLFIIVSVGLGFGEGYSFVLKHKHTILKLFNQIFIFFGIIFSIFLLYKFSYSGLIESRGMNLTGETKNMSEFAKLREGLNEKSPFGGIMEYSYQAEKLFKLYQKIIYRINDENKKVFLDEIQSLVGNLEKIVEKEPRYGGSYLAMSEMLNLYLLVDLKEDGLVKIMKGNYDKDVWNKSYKYALRAVEINRKNPPNYLVLAQLYMIKGDMDNSYLFAKRYLELAPEHEEGYSFARSLLKIKPNESFEKFVNEMEQKYLTGDN